MRQRWRGEIAQKLAAKSSKIQNISAESQRHRTRTELQKITILM